MNIKQTLQKGFEKLQKAGIPSARLDAEVILSFVLGKPKEFLYTHSDAPLTNFQLLTFNFQLARRARHYPVAYITKNKEFFNLNFYVDENVLIPRPETELLIEETLKLTQKWPDRALIRLAEIGTGSGCVTISLAKNLTKIRICATDISSAALKIAKRNARRHKVLSKIKFYQGNLLEPIKNKKFDLIIANLPYLDANLKNLLASCFSKSLKYEPQIALTAGKQGLDCFELFFQQVKNLKHKPKYILLEIGSGQAKQVTSLAKRFLSNVQIQISKDLAGKNRVIKMSFAS